MNAIGTQGYYNINSLILEDRSRNKLESKHSKLLLGFLPYFNEINVDKLA
jgi:hypothetical protein